MGQYLTTEITSPQIVAQGGVLSGAVATVAPAAGYYYCIMEQYNAQLTAIPGSRQFLYQSVVGGSFINSTTNFTVIIPTAAGQAGLGQIALTLPNSDCYTYLFLKEITAATIAGAFVPGTQYKILEVGTTDFTLIGATANVVGTLFTATGAGAGTGVACEVPDPDVDTTIDYLVIEVSSSSGSSSIDISSIMNLMITMMIVGMMMKMMSKSLMPA